MAGKRIKKRPTGKVLLVDPRPERLEEAAQGLREAGHRVCVLTRYEAAPALWSVFEPEVAVIAGRAPDFEGCVLGQRLRQLSRRALPVVYLIDAPDPQLKEHCLRAGHGVDALAQPLSTRELVHKVERQIELKRAQTKAVLSGEAVDRRLNDRLTGLGTRRLLLAVCDQDIRRAERFGGSFSIVVAQLRHCASARRTHGRELADRMVSYAAMALSQAVREADLVARIADDTFALLLPRTPAEAVPLVLERIRRAPRLMSGQQWGDGAPLLFGWAAFPEAGSSAAQLLAEAERELRQAQAASGSAQGGVALFAGQGGGEGDGRWGRTRY